MTTGCEPWMYATRPRMVSASKGDAHDMRVEPEIDGANVTLLGDFSPAIFAPAWFVLHGLLPESAADGAEVGIVHPQVTAFTFDWLTLEVTTERFRVETRQAPHTRAFDLVARTFAEPLNRTPLKAFGINREVHFQVRSQAERDLIGRTLAPVEPWGAWGHGLGTDGKHGGMTSLTMTQIQLDGRPPDDRINVTVEPSNRIGEGQRGVFVRVNDHYTTDDAGADSCERLMELLQNNFETSLKRGEGIVDHVMSLAGQ